MSCSHFCSVMANGSDESAQGPRSSRTLPWHQMPGEAGFCWICQWHGAQRPVTSFWVVGRWHLAGAWFLPCGSYVRSYCSQRLSHCRPCPWFWRRRGLEFPKTTLLLLPGSPTCVSPSLGALPPFGGRGAGTRCPVPFTYMHRSSPFSVLHALKILSALLKTTYVFVNS